MLLDAAMDAIEAENPKLRGVLPKTYGRADIDKRLLGGLVQSHELIDRAALRRTHVCRGDDPQPSSALDDRRLARRYSRSWCASSHR